MGGSQGGLLVGGTFDAAAGPVRRRGLQVPLRGHAALHQAARRRVAGWRSTATPDIPEQWAYIQTWSPYHLLKKDAKYPTPVLLDQHPRRPRAPGPRAQDGGEHGGSGHPVYYFENVEGGHGAGVVNKQTAQVTALEYAYLWKMLRGDESAPSGGLVHLGYEAARIASTIERGVRTATSVSGAASTAGP